MASHLFEQLDARVDHRGVDRPVARPAGRSGYGEALLDLAAGAAYYRLLWRGVALTEKQVEPLVDLILTGAS